MLTQTCQAVFLFPTESDFFFPVSVGQVFLHKSVVLVDLQKPQGCDSGSPLKQQG